MGNSEYTKCYLSEVGHKNFMYPSASSALLSPDCEFIALPWLGGRAENLKAVKVLKSCLTLLQIDENTKNNSLPPSADIYTVVWISDKHIAP